MGMKTVLEMMRGAVDFFFNLILPVDSEMEDLRTKSVREIFSLLRRVSDQKYDGMFAIFSYQDKLVRKMVWQMKFRECHWVAEVFGQFLAEFVLQKMTEGVCGVQLGTPELILIPTPLHPKRFAERGYNQCEWLCEEIMKNIRGAKIAVGAKMVYDKNILRRVKYRTKQSWSSRVDRFKNAENIFAVNERVEVAGRTFILIDDVVTTSATLNEARRTLLAAGASDVICFTIAH